MHFYIMTLFPEMFPGIMDASILGRAKTQGLLEWEAVNIRDYTLDKHMKVDDYPYGGGAGMVMQAEPIYRCYEALQQKMKPEPKKKRVIYVTPQGHVFDQKMAEDFAKEEELVFLCGHYEGVDERVLDALVDEQISIGDYVLTGGELPALVLVDCISRMVPGVLSEEACFTDESHFSGLLEYPQYTRPAVWEGRPVPEVLLSGHHANIEAWRRRQSLERTLRRRPDMLKNALLTEEETAYLQTLAGENSVE